MISEIPDLHPKTPNATIEQLRRDELHAARNHLFNAMITMPTFQEEYKNINNLIAEIEMLLGVK